MPRLITDDGVHLYVEETGSGAPILFIHEFAGDYRSWEVQVRFFGRLYRWTTYNARGAWQELSTLLAEHSNEGSDLMRGVQKARPRCTTCAMSCPA
jgi:pimeloyl-ACP methyl ester carboxylesterase